MSSSESMPANGLESVVLVYQADVYSPGVDKDTPVEVTNTSPIPVENVATPGAAPIPVELASVAPVEVTNAAPIPVAVEPAPGDVEAKRRAATARVEADTLRTADQRRISGIWERTQQVIALAVVLVTLLVSAWMVVTAGPDQAGVAFVFLASVANLVIGFYFGRTNHERSGGVPSPRDTL